MGNRLLRENNPYLRQHASDLVDWYPWGEEAFERAKKENKPIFLSIGYSTCHWCHVMQKESFKDKEIAEILNENFISIKVDREERPDLDKVYMQACLILNGRGGWPLSLFLTPEKLPFFAGTYFPKESRPGLIGFKELLLRIARLWKERQRDLREEAEKLKEFLLSSFRSPKSSQGLKEDVLHRAFHAFKTSFDPLYGGFGSAPKFPSPHNFLFLIKYFEVYKEPFALAMVKKSLEAMRRGGIYDHVGFGFHRYSTDEKWLLPHFEKMLYDQAMLLMAYTYAYKWTGEALFKRTCEEIVAYLLREMRDSKGGFYSAQDADSEGEEGKFYTWTYDELKNLLGEDFELFAKISNIKEEGNYLDEAKRIPSLRNIIHLSKSLKELELETHIPENRLKEIFEKALRILFEEREKRVKPFKDTKILTDWNALLILALTQAGLILNNSLYLELARETAKFLMEHLYQNGILYHSYFEGDVSSEGNLDDYAFLALALFELYQVTHDKEYLTLTLELFEKLLKDFWDKEEGGFFFTSEKNQDVIVRPKESIDGAYPSGNSLAYLLLVKLYKNLSMEEFKAYLEETEKAFAFEIYSYPAAHSMFLTAFMEKFF